MIYQIIIYHYYYINMNMVLISIILLIFYVQATEAQIDRDNDGLLHSFEDQEQFVAEWIEYLDDFNPENMMTFIIPSGGKYTFSEYAEKSGILRGAFTVSAKKTNKIKFMIKSPSGKVIFERENKKEAVIHYNMTEQGEYKLEFYNGNMFDKEEVSFGIQQKKSGEEILSEFKHEGTLQPAEEKLQSVEKNVNDVIVHHKFFEYRKNRQNEEVTEIGRRSMYIALVESISIILITVWQVYYIKKMLDFRQSVQPTFHNI